MEYHLECASFVTHLLSLDRHLTRLSEQQAEPLPISKQPSLVKFEKEGAKVIEYLATLTPSDTLEQYASTVIHAR